MAEDVLPLLRSFLVQRYGDLKRRLRRTVGNDELADDALHDTWLRLQRGEIQGPIANPQAYVMRMAVNFALEARRGQQQLLSAEDAQVLLDLVPDGAAGPERVAEDRSQLQALHEILEKMPARRRDILLLVRWEGWSQQDVAKHLGVSLRTVEYELKAGQDYCATRLAQRNGRPG